jgi:hypothetical protein
LLNQFELGGHGCNTVPRVQVGLGQLVLSYEIIFQKTVTDKLLFCENEEIVVEPEKRKQSIDDFNLSLFINYSERVHF